VPNYQLILYACRTRVFLVYLYINSRGIFREALSHLGGIKGGVSDISLCVIISSPAPDMCTELFRIISQPARPCKAVQDVKIASKMNPRQWQRLRVRAITISEYLITDFEEKALVIDAAARFLNTQDRYEHQDPEMVRLFYQAVSFNRVLCCIASLLHPLSQVHATWPEVAAKYPNSWVLVWYLKIYLLKRVYRKRWSEKVARERASSQARQQPRRLRVAIVCSVFCIIK
jgi:hypothetical protein